MDEGEWMRGQVAWGCFLAFLFLQSIAGGPFSPISKSSYISGMAQQKQSGALGSLLIIVLLLIALFVVKQCKRSGSAKTDPAITTTQKDTRGLNRDPSVINYSKHARCRMDCRHIDEAEVKDILANGKINYSKSEIGDNPDCKRRYAVEGNTRDNQRVRIIFAPCQTEVTVVTVIDLGKEWACDCQ